MKLNPKFRIVGKLLLIFMVFGLPTISSASNSSDELSAAAENYVRLGLELGQYDKDYVDAYLGPKEWQEQAAKPRSKVKLAADIKALKEGLASMSFVEGDNSLRHRSLTRNVRAMDIRARMINGETFSFVDEARLIYDVVLPEFDFNQFDNALVKIDALLPGDGELASRVDSFRSSFDIPADKLQKVISTAIKECRVRSKRFISMPEQESFTLEYVTDKSWSGYNWYQGENISLMQINQDFPTKIDSAIGLGCHEGYPGHHVWNVLIEEELIKGKGWVEFNLYPLGSAEYGVSLAFPGDEKTKFEHDVLYPMAGLESKDANVLAQLKELLNELKYSRIAIGQQYLDGEITREEAVKRTVKYSLVSQKRAQSSIKFLEQYRAYVLNYSIGEDLIEAYIARNSNTHAERWAQFITLLTKLNTASDLR